MYWYFDIALAIFVFIWIYSIVFNMVQVFFVASNFLVYEMGNVGNFFVMSFLHDTQEL